VNLNRFKFFSKSADYGKHLEEMQFVLVNGEIFISIIFCRLPGEFGLLLDYKR
jgi:hypothetical protein